MDDGAIEDLARSVRIGVGLADEDVIVSMVEVVERCLGRGALSTGAPGRGASLVRTHDEYRIVVRDGTPDVRFALAHELGHWALRVRARATFADLATEERAANTFAAVLLAPRALVARAYEFFGERVDVIASKLSISQTSTALRLGEVRGDERAVVTRTRFVHVRNASPRLTPARALEATERRVPGVVKTRLRGGIDEGRVALRVG
jgi:hypothetical protein